MDFEDMRISTEKAKIGYKLIKFSKNKENLIFVAHDTINPSFFMHMIYGCFDLAQFGDKKSKVMNAEEYENNEHNPQDIFVHMKHKGNMPANRFKLVVKSINEFEIYYETVNENFEQSDYNFFCTSFIEEMYNYGYEELEDGSIKSYKWIKREYK